MSVYALMLAAGSACSSNGLVGVDSLPSDISDPALTKTPDGALNAYRGTLAQFRNTFAGESVQLWSFVAISGILSDELQSIGTVTGSTRPVITHLEIDSRNVAEGGIQSTPNGTSAVLYSNLNKIRAQAIEAIGLATHYAPEFSPAIRGHLYAIQGYIEIFLAELFCSGIPLSTITFEGDYTLQAGSSTAEVYAHAIAHFDTALSLSADSSSIMHLARVGKARALLGTGDFAGAIAALVDIPQGYEYAVRYLGPNDGNFAYNPYGYLQHLTVADREGLNGLDYISSQDPRTTSTSVGSNAQGFQMYRPEKYEIMGSTSVILASWIEAELIRSEVLLRDGTGSSEWLNILNDLRTDGTFTVTPGSGDPAVMDTIWGAGTGGIAGLHRLDDPMDATDRVSLLFRERAFWLFLTGQRQGDMRRLIRQYQRNSENVYPKGRYRYPDINGVYGSFVNLPVPSTERRYNPKYAGCMGRGA